MITISVHNRTPDDLWTNNDVEFKENTADAVFKTLET